MIRRPEMLMVTRRSAIIGIVEKQEKGDSVKEYPNIERTAQLDLPQITRIEELVDRKA